MPKHSVKDWFYRQKTNFKLITEPAFLPNTCYVRLWVFKTKRKMKILLGIAMGFIVCILWIYYRWTKD